MSIELDDSYYWKERFKKTESREPSCFHELMDYAYIITRQEKQHSDFWKGVFGL